MKKPETPADPHRPLPRPPRPPPPDRRRGAAGGHRRDPDRARQEAGDRAVATPNGTPTRRRHDHARRHPRRPARVTDYRKRLARSRRRTPSRRSSSSRAHDRTARGRLHRPAASGLDVSTPARRRRARRPRRLSTPAPPRARNHADHTRQRWRPGGSAPVATTAARTSRPSTTTHSSPAELTSRSARTRQQPKTLPPSSR